MKGNSKLLGEIITRGRCYGPLGIAVSYPRTTFPDKYVLGFSVCEQRNISSKLFHESIQ